MQPSPDPSPHDGFERLFNAARAGDEIAFGELLNYYRGLLCHVVAQNLSGQLLPKAGASEIVQETYLKATAGFPGFDGTTEGKFKNWLLAILQNTLLNHIRTFRDTQQTAVGREVRIDTGTESGVDGDSLKAQGKSPSSDVGQAEEVERLRQALATLPTEDQELILLYQEVGENWTKISQRLGVSDKTAKVRVLAALGRLREKLTGP